MTLIPRAYLEVLKRRDFFVLISTLFIGQLASAFLLLSLISTIFAKTGSNFGVSGVILSLALPGFLLMAFAGLVADLFDRKKIIISANLVIALIVLLIIFSIDRLFAPIFFSFLYFAGNTFFIPAISAASGQLVPKSKLLAANSIFVLALSGIPVLGLMAAAVLQFFLGSFVVLVVCEIFLIGAFALPFLLPTLAPRKHLGASIFGTISEIWQAFVYIFRRKLIWFFFVVFALMQGGVVAFGVTLAPGFFDEVVRLPIQKSPIFVLPFIGLGVALGAMFAHNTRIRKSVYVALGIGAMGFPGFILGLIIKFGAATGLFLLLPLVLFLVFTGFGVIISIIASRTVLQRYVAHNYQGTVFGADAVLATFLAAVSSPLAATLEVLFGYVNLLIFIGAVFAIGSGMIGYMGKKWKF